MTYTLSISRPKKKTTTVLVVDHAETIAGIVDKARQHLPHHLGVHLIRVYVQGPAEADWYTACRYPAPDPATIAEDIEDMAHRLHARLSWLADYPDDADPLEYYDPQAAGDGTAV